MFSEFVKHDTASNRELITGIESEGRMSQVRSKDLPNVVLVPLRMPTRECQYFYGLIAARAHQRRIIPPWFYPNELMHDSRL